MRFVSLIILAIFSSAAFAEFVHPLDFNGSDEQKKEVLQYITSKVKTDYCEKIDMCQEYMLRAMEQENLSAFKRLTKATDRSILDRAIQDYCGAIDMCTYQTIEMMYKENLSAKEKSLEW